MALSGLNSITNYDDELKDFIEQNEGTNTKVHDDGLGIPTIGAGYALTMHSTTWLSDFANAGITLTAAQEAALNQLISDVKSNPENGSNLIKAYQQGANTVDITGHVGDLFLTIKGTYEGYVKTKLGTQLYNSLLNTQEMVALVDLAYNGGAGIIGNNLKQALESGNRAEAWFEIRYQSNGGDSYLNTGYGIANRRVAESNRFKLYPDNASEEDYKQVLRMSIRNESIIYAVEHDSYTPTDNQLPVGAAYLNNEAIVAQLDPAKNHLITNYAQGITIDGEIYVGAGLDSYAYKEGQDINDDKTGTSKNDLMFGERGIDTLNGGDGQDVLYGGEGDDTLYGGDGQDILIGGAGNDHLHGNQSDAGKYDILDGGEDDDTYYITSADGDTIIRDSDLNGSIQFNGKTLGTGLKAIAEGLKVYIDDDNNDYVLIDGTLNITLSTGQKIIVEGFGDDISTTKLGLTFGDADPLPAPGAGNVTIVGDYEWKDFDPDTTGIQSHTDALGNEIQNFDKPLVMDDTLNGSADNDLIRSGDGKDLVDGKGGDDNIQGGLDVDILKGGEGNDTIQGNAGSDVIYGGVDDDVLYADDIQNITDAMNAELPSNQKGSLLSGGDDKDTLVGDVGNDTIMGGAGEDILIGSAGDDNLYGDSQLNAAQIDWALMRDVTFSNNITFYNSTLQYGDWEVSTEGANDVLIGGAGNDWLFGELGNDYLDGGNGDDVIFGEEGSDVISGGDGNDVLNGDSASQTSDFGDDTLDGGQGDDELYGGIGDDTLDGGQGDDELYGGVGDDLLLGSTGKDVLYGNEGADTLDGGQGDDELYGGIGDDLLLGGTGKDVLYGNQGQDKLYGDEGNDYLNGNEGDDQLFGGNGDDYFEGGEGNDQLQGGEGYDYLSGGSGDDTLLGEADDDQLYGNEGDDRLFGGTGDDNIYGGSGDDYIVSGKGTDSLWGGVGSDTYAFSTGDGSDLIFGGDGQDKIVFNSGIDISGLSVDVINVDGGAYLSIQYGTNDFVFIENGLEGAVSSVEFADGTHWDIGDFFNQVLTTSVNYTNANGTSTYGGSSADTLIGSELSDQIYGGGGDDKIAGAGGDDMLSGGQGIDTYLLGIGTGSDLIQGESNESNAIELLADVTLSDLNLLKSGNDLIVNIVDSSDQVTIQDYFLKSKDWSITTSEGVTTTISTMINQVQAQAHAASVEEAKDLYVTGVKNYYKSFLQGSGYEKQGDKLTKTVVRESSDYKNEYHYSIGMNVVDEVSDEAYIQRNLADYEQQFNDLGSYNETASSLDTSGASYYLISGSSVNTPKFISLDELKSSGTSGISIPGNYVPSYSSTEARDPLTGQLGKKLEGFYVYPDGQALNYLQKTFEHHTFSIDATKNIWNLTASSENNIIDISGDVFDVIDAGGGDDRIYTNGWYGQPQSYYYSLPDTTRTAFETVPGNFVYGGDGNDYIQTDLRNDTLVGGTGDDQLNGAGGNDRYIFFNGDGNDIVMDDGFVGDLQDVIQLPDIVTQESLTAEWTEVSAASYDSESAWGGMLESEHIALKISWGTDDSVSVAIPRDYQSYGYGIDYIELGNGEKIAFSTLVDNAGDMPAQDPQILDNTLEGKGYLYGGDGDDTLISDSNASSEHALTNYTASDVLNPKHTRLIGGGGYDTLIGSDGSDELFGGDIYSSQTFLGDYPLFAFSDLWDDGNYFDAGGGDDLIWTTAGNDVIKYELGDGHDIVADFYGTSFVQSFQHGGEFPEDIVSMLEDTNIRSTLADDSIQYGWNDIAAMDPVHKYMLENGVDEIRLGEGILPSEVYIGQIPAQFYIDNPNITENEFDPRFLDFRLSQNSLNFADGGSLTLNETQDLRIVFADGTTWQSDELQDILNGKLVVADQLKDQNVDELSTSTYTISDDLFVHNLREEDERTYTARLGDGQSLPDWITFNSETKSFEFSPGQDDAGLYNITLTVTNSWPEQSIDLNFSLNVDDTVNSVNQAPTVAVSLSDQSVDEFSAFEFVIPEGSFVDVDPNDSLSYSATLTDDNALPSWLTFDADTKTFSGTPDGESAGDYIVKVLAADKAGLTAESEFTLSVADMNPDLYGSNGNDVIYGSTYAEKIDGYAGDDTIYGYAGNDVLKGGLGDDVLIGGKGNDSLDGGKGGSDTYLFNLGDGQDTVRGEAIDKIIFGVGITQENLRISAINNNYDTLIQITDDQGALTGDQITLSYSFINSSYNIGAIEFFDGTSLSGDDIDLAARTFIGTEAADNFTGTNRNDTLTAYSGDDVIDASRGDDIIYAGDGDDVVDGGRDNDIIYGGAGNDILHGGEVGGNDYIVGGLGNDTIDGGAGDDIYLFNQGDGQDIIRDYSGIDKIVFGAGISKDNIQISQSGSTDIVLTLTDDSGVATGDSLTLIYAFRLTGYAIEQLEFDDGSMITNEELQIAARIVEGTDGPDSIEGSRSDDTLIGYNGDDELKGYGGADLLEGGAGDDSLYGHDGDDTLIGGTGNDYMEGGKGNDIFQFNIGDGQDYVFGGQGDKIVFGEGISAENILVTQDHGNHLVVNLLDDNGVATGDTLTLHYAFRRNVSDIESLSFNDGTEITGAQMMEMALTVEGTSGDDVLTGSYRADTMYGYEGNDVLDGDSGIDTLYGGAGDDTLIGGFGGGADTLIGGTGNDTLEGVDGDDTYIFNAGDGQDTIIDYSGIDKLVFGEGITRDNLAITQKDNADIVISLVDNNRVATGDQITVKEVFRNANYTIESIGFANGEIMTSTELMDAALKVNGTDAADTLVGSSMNDEMYGQAGNDVLNGDRGDDTLYGGAGDDTLIGGFGGGADTLIGGTGNDTLEGVDGDDTYIFNAGDGQDTILDYAGNDKLTINNASTDDLWFSLNAHDLQINIVGTDDQIKVDGWSYKTDNQIEEIAVGSSVLLNTQVEQLVSAMAAFDIPSGVGNVIPDDVKQQLQPILAETWHQASQ